MLWLFALKGFSLQVLGYILAFQNRLALHLSRVVVAAPYRRRGIAKQLILVRLQYGCHTLLQSFTLPMMWQGLLRRGSQSCTSWLAGGSQQHEEELCNPACRSSESASTLTVSVPRLSARRRPGGLLQSRPTRSQAAQAPPVRAEVVPDRSLSSTAVLRRPMRSNAGDRTREAVTRLYRQSL